MKGMKLKSGLIFGLVVLLLTTSIAPRGIGQTHTLTQQQNITATSLPSTEKTSSFTLYVIGKNGLEKQEKILSASNTLRIYEKYQELKKEMTSNPYNDKTQRVTQEFFDLLVENHALPTGISKDQLLSLTQPPVIPPKHLRTDIHPIQNKASEWFCNFATFGEGSAFPIIILPRLIPFLLMPIPRAFVWWSTPEGLTSVGGLISHTGFLAGGQQKGIALGFWGIGFSIFLPPIMSYGILGYAVFTRVTAEEFQFYPPNNPPEITQTDPADGQQMIPLSTTNLRFEIKDANGDLMSYNVTTEPDIGSGSGGLKPDGTYSIPISGLEDLTKYTWYVEVTDGKDTTEKTLTFTTEAIAPIISNPLPANGERDVPMDISQLQFTLKDYQGDAMDYTVETSPDIGSAQATGIHDATYTVPVSGLTYGAAYRWYVNATDGTHWTRKIFSFETEYPSQYNPFEFGWEYRKQITIDHSKVAGNLTNFPVLVSTVDVDLSQKTQADGDDILFMNAPGVATRLNYEIEQFDANSGKLVAWVNITTLSSNDDTTFYMYYGNPTCLSQQYPEKTWDSNYLAVYHQKYCASGLIDSTKYARNGTVSGSPATITGKIDGAIDYDGSGAYYTIGNIYGADKSEFTWEIWFNPDTITSDDGIVGNVGAVVPCFAVYNSRWYIQTPIGGTTYTNTSRLLTVGNWQFATISYTDGDDTLRYYYNGQRHSTLLTDGGLAYMNFNLRIGRYSGTTHCFDGKIDELRLSDIQRSANWISTEFNNQNNPSGFMIFGPEVPGP